MRRGSLPPMTTEFPRGSKEKKRTAEQFEPDVDVEDDEPSSKRRWFVEDIEDLGFFSGINMTDEQLDGNYIAFI